MVKRRLVSRRVVVVAAMVQVVAFDGPRVQTGLRMETNYL